MCPERPYGQEGASLILALVFVTAASLLLAALVSLSGTNMIATASLKNLRSVQYSADGVTEEAVQAVRYQTYSSTATSCPSSSTTPVVSDTVDGETMWVSCQASQPSIISRQVTFFTCQVSGGCDSNSAVLQADVIYNDLDPACKTPNSPTPSCVKPGESVQVVDWTVIAATS